MIGQDIENIETFNTVETVLPNHLFAVRLVRKSRQLRKTDT